VGDVGPWDHALMVGIRAAAWLDVAFGVTALAVVVGFFWGAGKVGGKH